MAYAKNRSVQGRLALAALLLLLLAPASPQAQTDPPDPEEEPYEPPPPAPRDDPGVEGDPLPAEDLSVLGQPLLEGTQELDIAVSDVPLPESFAPLGPAAQSPTPTTCEGYTGAVTPIQVSATYPHYFSYGAPATPQTILLVGVSADAACHMDLVDKNDLPDPFKCRMGNYPAIFSDLKARGLNKIRLWVAVSGHANENPNLLPSITAREPANQPFLYVDEPLPNVPKTQGYYRFDQINRPYFERLKNVVREAKRNDLFVEVTFFAPFEGERSPWVASNKKAAAPNPTTGLIEQVGLTDPRWFVLSGPPNAANVRVQGFQKAIIDWTIDWLWCYDNVWWEIANEPEQGNLDANRAIAWQQQMIAYTKASEARYLRTNAMPNKPLKARHPIAVQPFHKLAADFWRTPSGTCSVATPAGCRPDVINGHYTQVLTNPATAFPTTTGGNRLEVGAIRLIREYSNPMKVFGFNEDNITPLGGPKGTRTFKTDIPSTTPDARQFGLPDPVRTEAWEFLFHGGGTFDHFGYKYTDPNGQKVRDHLGRIRAFLTGIRVHELIPSTAFVTSQTTAGGSGWADVGDYPTKTSWDTNTLSRKHWAAMESRNWRTATGGRQFLLHEHRSTPRCKVDTDDFKLQTDGTLRCTGVNLAFDAYDGRRRPTARYQEIDLVLHLGAKPGIFDVFWLDPTNPSAAPLAQEQIQWQPSPESCKGSSPCKITSPRYPYDALLRIVQR